MRITVWYEDGGLEEFDTTALTTAGALGAPDAMTDVAVRLVEGDGMWAELSWYDSACSGGGDEQLAPRRAGCRAHLLSEDELARVRSCDVDGTRWLTRVGPDLVDERRLSELLSLLYEPPVEGMSLARRAVWLLGHLADADDGLGMDGALSLMGMTRASYQFLSRHDAIVPDEVG
ncbi:hypothetical protein HF885_09835 [Olsenella umbonata]|uniref:Uncharacterized protein n=3 Tax=Atopobiaceae TaxID=1643824 RepID=A0A117J4S2_TRASO|nr:MULTISPECIES: hypothetical protein [Atopobiaceae]MCH4083868.1 hypothetical protein [Olsenella sp.]MDY3901910.1 hypothetical protein [Atopobiaceae bacterium]KUH59334.1 hypothetical protein AUL39_03165 [Tractidigestivibacter scatoligenes]MST73253.1 hypothetical protein [Olsenella porci]NMF26715.1 hypothetical protein [Parafannyhessea umbonata]